MATFRLPLCSRFYHLPPDTNPLFPTHCYLAPTTPTYAPQKPRAARTNPRPPLTPFRADQASIPLDNELLTLQPQLYRGAPLDSTAPQSEDGRQGRDYFSLLLTDLWEGQTVRGEEVDHLFASKTDKKKGEKRV